MNTSEREIREDTTIARPVLYIFMGVVIGLLLLDGALIHTAKDWLFIGGVILFIVIFAPMVLHSARDGSEFKKKWKMTEAGLQRIYPSGETETIRWEQIRHIRWVRFYGLIVGWDESKAERQHRHKIFKEEFKWDVLYRRFRATLRVQRDEAQELISMVRSKTGLSEKQLTA